MMKLPKCQMANFVKLCSYLDLQIAQVLAKADALVIISSTWLRIQNLGAWVLNKNLQNSSSWTLNSYLHFTYV